MISDMDDLLGEFLEELLHPPPIIAIPATDIAITNTRKTILTLGSYECRCLVDELDKTNTYYCGAPVFKRSCCETHYNKYWTVYQRKYK